MANKIVDITIPNWLYVKKKGYGYYEVADITELNHGMPVNMKEAIIYGSIIEEREKAIKVQAFTYQLDMVDIWLPKSQIIKIEEEDR